MNIRLFLGCSLLLIATDGLARGLERPVMYPQALRGYWEIGHGECKLPGNPDSDGRIEITKTDRYGYEDSSKPIRVIQISKVPLAWKIKSRLNIYDDLSTQYDGQVIDRDGDGQLKQRDIFLESYERTLRGESFVVTDEGAWPPGVTFDSGEVFLKPYAIDLLKEAAILLKKSPEIKVEISGHTDSIGSKKYNQQLSTRRARVTYEYLISLGVDPSRLSPVGYGESRPISPNTNEDGSDYPEGRAKNRRIELNVEN